MTDDIVTRLREFTPCCGLHCEGYNKRETDPDCLEAADEIERLREALIELVDQCSSVEEELTEKHYRVACAGESSPLCNARAVLARRKS